ncbi:amidohydrolase family protein [Microvirga antarctica]|uniref:amidohydrolase family protein n=1 Tax=Microvirga antarctica TaxID=2819233 RepID=UPI001B31453C|nr:amidohydrolase family protein [Microvirga antarctica]
MAHRTLIRAGMIIAFQDGEHRLLRNGVVVVEDDRVVHVGPSFEGTADEVVDLPDHLLTPGLIDAHAHLTSAPLDRSFIEDVGRPNFSFSGLPEMLPALATAIDEPAQRAIVDFSMAELIRSGTTTVMEIGWLGDYTAAAAEKAGLRAYIAEGYGSARWKTTDGKRMTYAWKEDGGIPGFRYAIDLIERIDGRGNGRIKGYLSPMQVAMATPELLRLSREASDRMGVPLALHTAEAVFEFDEMVQREGMTPIEWLAKMDFLSDRCILGHVVFTSGNSWIQYPGDDLAILADHGASVAHCPWVFARRGIAMESFPSYLAAGVNMCLGSDTAPQSILQAMRTACVVGKLMSRDCRKATAREAFDAATLNAARMLHRDDIGRIAKGAKADLLLWNLRGFSMNPCRDPLKNLVYSAEAADLRHVMVDGRWLMRDHALLTVDEAGVTRGLAETAERVWSAIGPGDWAGRDIDTLSPPSLGDFR